MNPVVQIQFLLHVHLFLEKMAGPSMTADWCNLCLRMSTGQIQYQFYKISENTDLFYKLQYCIPEFQLVKILALLYLH